MVDDQNHVCDITMLLQVVPFFIYLFIYLFLMGKHGREYII